MKCLVENVVSGTLVFETSKIAYMRKKDFHSLDRGDSNEYCIYIHFDNGDSEELKFFREEKRDEEWQRIMKCWRSDELCVATGSLTAGD